MRKKCNSLPYKEILMSIAVTNLMAADEISRTLKLIKINELNAGKLTYPENDPEECLRERPLPEMLEDVRQTIDNVTRMLRPSRMK